MGNKKSKKGQASRVRKGQSSWEGSKFLGLQKKGPRAQARSSQHAWALFF